MTNGVLSYYYAQKKVKYFCVLCLTEGHAAKDGTTD